MGAPAVTTEIHGKSGLTISQRLFHSHLLTGLLASIAVGAWLLFAARAEILDAHQRQRNTTLAVTAAALDPAAALLVQSRQDIGTPAHEALRDRLSAILKADPELRRLTLLRREASELRVVIDVGSPLALVPGDPHTLDGGLRILLPDGRHLLRAETSHTNVDERLAEITRLALLSFLFTVALSLLLGHSMGRYAHGVLQRMAQACRNIAEGRFGDRLAVHSRDEFEELANAFNRMAEHLQRSRGDLEESLKQTRAAQQRLEQNIRERSQELDKLNNLLRKEIEQRCQLEASLAEAAATDTLTKLLNRRAMLELVDHILKRLIPQSRVCAFFLLDIDHFKKVNDTYGHEAGDEVLRSVSLAIKAELNADEAAARWGGEEFLLMWPDCNATQAEHRANRLRELIGSQRWLKDGKPVTISGGVVVMGKGMSFDEALSRADVALYKAKEQGRNRILMG
ncbi:MAG: diguanylate cyclase [Xanthomonadales bacterium]|jgi:diguanylate cyclase (GGDEF)-like protein|nr:diguanylate cyclase [Xanthomonadales bacterium]